MSREPVPESPPGPAGVDFFLDGNDMRRRWRGRDRFVVFVASFGDGAAFLRTWRAWRGDAGRCERLVVLAVASHPTSPDDLRRALRLDTGPPADAEALAAAWPPMTPDLHRLAFEDGRVQLLLGVGPLATWLPEFVADIDAFYLDGSATSDWSGDDPLRRCKSLGRLAAPGATLAASPGPAPDPAFRAGLRSAGFIATAAPDGTVLARFEPRFIPPRPRRAHRSIAAERHALIVGAGLAGCATAQALAEQGWRSTLLDRHDRIAAEASGNPAGLFHGTLHEPDGAHARFNRAAALAVSHAVDSALAHGVAGARRGLLRLERRLSAGAMGERLARLGLPPEYVQALDAPAASALAGLPMACPCWFYPGGGWIAPAGLAGDFLRRAGSAVELRTGVDVSGLVPGPQGWRLTDRQGATLADAPCVVLANGFEALRLLGESAWPVHRIRGQLSTIRQPPFALPRLPIAGHGYAIAAPDGALVFGATAQLHDPDPSVRAADHALNLAQLERLLGNAGALDLDTLAGRTGWRCSAVDRLPLIGAAPDPAAPAPRRDQARFVARRPGLFMFTGLGSRGITWSALGAQVLAAGISGAPMPLPASLLDGVDPARFALAGRSGLDHRTRRVAPETPEV